VFRGYREEIEEMALLTRIDAREHRGDAARLLTRPLPDLDSARDAVRELVRDVRARGDEAVRDAEERFAGRRPDALRVSPEEAREALATSAPQLRSGLEGAAARIRDVHEAQLADERAAWWRVGDDDARVGEETRPLARVGCYVPGGRAAYPSTALMTALAARVAGVDEVVVCAPGGADGVHPATLAACAVAEVDEIYAVGGAQAIAALAYGTQSIRRVDKVVGPGSIWVTLAKHEVAMDVGVDGFAGPTEVAIVADESAPAAFVAADLVAQAEHDPLATAILITDSETLIGSVEDALVGEVERSPRRPDVEKALEGGGRAVLVRDLDQALEIADAFAPEHLELVCEDAASRLARVRNAGAVFIGAYSPVAIGDYVAGTNHVLPTAGTARFASPLRVADFFKSTAVVQFSRAGLERVAPWLRAIAGAEGLDAHARAVEVRLS
jgi:histidinol dehydrogenase